MRRFGLRKLCINRKSVDEITEDWLAGKLPELSNHEVYFLKDLEQAGNPNSHYKLTRKVSITTNNISYNSETTIESTMPITKAEAMLLLNDYDNNIKDNRLI